MRVKILRLTGFIFAAVFLAAAQLRGILLVFGPRTNNHIAAVQGIVQGLPHWRIYQSRVLGPFFVEAMRSLTGLTFGQAYLLAMFILLLVFFLVLILTARCLWNSTIAALATAVAAMAFNSILMQGLWLYPWDYIDLTVFTLLMWAILASKSVWLIGSILAFEIFNREVVIILSIWLTIDAIFKLMPAETKWPKLKVQIHWGQFFIALGLLAIGCIVVEVLRNVLLIREIGPEIFSDVNVKESGSFFNVQLLKNLRDLCFSFTHPVHKLHIAFNILMLGIPLLALCAICHKHIGVIRVGLLYLMLWGCTVTFGIIYEMRVWVSFVPFLVLVFPAVFLERSSCCFADRKIS